MTTRICELHRFSATEQGTYGVLLDHKKQPICCTVERPWMSNLPNISCIPSGIYSTHTRLRGSTNQLVYELDDVPGRTYIQIHVANKPSQLKGCIAPVTSFGELDGELGGFKSAYAFRKFMEHLECGEVNLILNVTGIPMKGEH